MEAIPVILIFGVLLGLIPAMIARGKGQSFLGWWIYGALLFIVALPHAIIMKADEAALDENAVGSGSRKKCPHCAELIRPEARVCRFCGREIGANPGAPARSGARCVNPVILGAYAAREPSLRSYGKGGSANSGRAITEVIANRPRPDARDAALAA